MKKFRQRLEIALLCLGCFWGGRWYEREHAAVPSAPREPSSVTTACSSTPTEFRCVRYISNHDGDTIKVEIPDVHPLLGRQISVRVRGIDTPEIQGRSRCEKERAQEAKALVARALRSARQIDLVDLGRDKYFRILADVRVDGASLKQMLTKERLGYEYDGGTKQRVDWCRR